MCLQEVHGKEEFLQALQVLAPRYKFLGTFQSFASTKIFCLKNAIVTHMITCQGRDHVVNVQSVRKNLVIVNVHFERDLETLT